MSYVNGTRTVIPRVIASGYCVGFGNIAAKLHDEEFGGGEISEVSTANLASGMSSHLWPQSTLCESPLPKHNVGGKNLRPLRVPQNIRNTYLLLLYYIL